MKEYKFKNMREIQDAYPHLFRDPKRGWCDVMPGWFPLVARLVVYLDSMIKHDHLEPVEIAQIKEKFGRLRIYISYNEKASIIVNVITHIASTICEYCGDDPVELYLSPGSWRKTLCEECGIKHRGGLAPWHDGDNWDSGSPNCNPCDYTILKLPDNEIVHACKRCAYSPEYSGFLPNSYFKECLAPYLAEINYDPTA